MMYAKLIGAGIVVAVLAASHAWTYNAGKNAVLSKLQDDRVTILKDGNEIDEKVLSADDSALCAILGGCLSDDEGN